MATLTLEVDDQTMARAEEMARETGLDYKSDLVARLQQFTSQPSERRMAAFRRLVESADAHPGVIEDGPLNSEQRNER